jgi:Gnt-I system high-affinity gluconate transporter
MPLAIVAIAIITLVALVVWAKVHPFLAFVIVSAAAAFALGMPAGDIAGAIRKGIGDILGALTIVIVTGAMLGKLVVESGAAQRIASVLVKAFGERRMAWAMAITGFIVGIPLFYGVGFVLLVPIVFAVIAQYRLPALVVGVPACAAMSVAHGLLPPHPAPTALVATFNANLGLTLIYGLIVAVPAIILAGPVFARTLAGIQARPLPGFAAEPKPESELPGAFISIVTALLPAVLLLLTTVRGFLVPTAAQGGVPESGLLRFLSDPDVVMIIALVFATVSLGLARGRSLPGVMNTFGRDRPRISPSDTVANTSAMIITTSGSERNRSRPDSGTPP